jgi:hydrogenase maturation protease
LLVREQQTVEGLIEMSAKEVGERLFRVTVHVSNQTSVGNIAAPLSREAALLHAFASTHVLLGARRGGFVSLTDPPDSCKDAASACENRGAWPVLIGSEGESESMLSSPIILYDNPQVAPESPGDLFDGLEIDEILSLRIMTLTDEEKGAMAAVDDRAGALLARTESLARDQLLGLHGTVRGLRTLDEEATHG